MSYLGGIALGVSSLLGISSLVSGNYIQLTLYGGQACFDDVEITNNILTLSDIEQEQIDTPSSWTSNVVFLSDYEDSNFDAGNIKNLINPITDYELYRQKNGETTLTLLSDLDVNVTSYIDETAQPNVDYIYSLVPKNSTERASPIEGEITTNFYGHYLIDPETYQVFLFDLNSENDGASAVTAYTRHDGFNEYSSYTFGDRNFLKGTITAITAESLICGEDFIQTPEYIKILKDFIANKKPKIFKTRKGEVYKVLTFNFSYKPLNNSVTQQPYLITFDWEQVGDVNG